MYFATGTFVVVFLIAWFVGVVVIPRLGRPAPATQPSRNDGSEPGTGPPGPR
jgi:p-aminobenzoyl-glutamate transporter AbgT